MRFGCFAEPGVWLRRCAWCAKLLDSLRKVIQGFAELVHFHVHIGFVYEHGNGQVPFGVRNAVGVIGETEGKEKTVENQRLMVYASSKGLLYKRGWTSCWSVGRSVESELVI